MGRNPRRKPSAIVTTKISSETDDSSLSPHTATNSTSCDAPPTPLIKLRPMSVLVGEDNQLIASQFQFGENSLSDPLCEVSNHSNQPTQSIPSTSQRPEDPLILSSDTETEAKPEPKVKSVRPKKDKAKIDKAFVTPTKPRGRLQKQLTGNYHKVTDYFSVTPRRNPDHVDKENILVARKGEETAIKSQLPVPSKHSPVTSQQVKSVVDQLPQYNDSKSIRPVTKFQVHRKISKSTDLRKISNRYHTRDQKRMETFFDSTGGGEGCSYFQTYPSSYFPVEISGEFDVEKVVSCLQDHKEIVQLEIKVERESIMIDLKEEGVELDQQRKLLETIQGELGKLVEIEASLAMSESEGSVQIVDRMEDDEVISIGSSLSDQDDEEYVPKKEIEKPKRRGGKPGAKAKKPATKAKVAKAKIERKRVVCPSYKIIKGTKFAVDAFRFGNIEHVTHYFLTHFHSDHYIGLNKKFSHPIYMSTVTANLVRGILKVEEQYIRPMELKSPVMIDDVEVTALDANHCPGAVMFVFKLPNGECILHVGDFRACPEMEMEPIFWNNHMNCIYLDTTYLTSRHEHPTQSESIDQMKKFVDKYTEENIGVKYVIIVGTYVIGKEKVWSGLARHLGCRVWLEKSRQEAVECYEDSSLLELLEVDPTKALIHVLPLQNVFYDNLKEYMSQFEDVFTHALAIRPSGWERNTKSRRMGQMTIMGIQYSEHSSYSELERFVRHLMPDEVISTVPLGSDLSKVPTVPEQWLNKEVEPKRSGQQSITSFLKVRRTKRNLREETSDDQEDEGALDLSMKVSPNRSIAADDSF